MQDRNQRLFLIVFTAIVTLALLSMCPWGEWTGGWFKDFNLLGGVEAPTPKAIIEDAGNIDPELAQLQDAQKANPEPVDSDTVVQQVEITYDFKAPVKDGIVLFEDYSKDKSGLAKLKQTLSEASSRRVRIAMVGDSYIEGDILAQDIRAGLQSRYGGNGVGYVAAFSAFPGFRRSVTQISQNWGEREIRKMGNDTLRTILGHYHIAESAPDMRYQGSAKTEHASEWKRTMILFMAPTAGRIDFSGPDNEAVSYEVEPTGQLQCLVHEAPTGDIRIKSDIVGLKVLGVWLEDPTGVVLDGISLRGNSGISHRRLNAATTSIMRQWVDYDLIILEFGMNALSAEQTDYTAYGNVMLEVVNNLKRLYPNAQILIMGVGDRGTKIGTDYVSMSTLPALIKAQRELAQRTGSLFYDTRAAMGGENSAIGWHARKLINSDYVHLNHKGGKELADIILNSLDTSLSDE